MNEKVRDLSKIYKFPMESKYCEKLHPNILRIYIIAISITALIWILFLFGILELGIVGFFLLTIFTILLIISVLSNPPGSTSKSDVDDGEGQTEGHDIW